MPHRDYSDHYKVLLGEFIHLLSLFWIHSCTAKTARASEVLFNQLMQHLNILGKMAHSEDGILIRRGYRAPDSRGANPDYLVLFGDVMINSKQELAESAASRQFHHLKSALGRAFECFDEQEIHALHLSLPGRSAERIEQFRFSMHILTRYQSAVRDGNSIAFRYYGRSLTLPLVADADGRVDPNLTVMAALNGLSAVNARELIKQAEAYHKMNLAEFPEVADPRLQVSSYNKIFSVRSLRSQIIKPPVEMNNLFYSDGSSTLDKRSLVPSEMPGDEQGASASHSAPKQGSSTGATELLNALPADARTAIDRYELAACLNNQDPAVEDAVDALFADDYPDLESAGLGKRFATISRLLYAVDKRCQNPAVIDRIIDLLHMRLKRVTEKVMANIISQRQGIRIIDQGRAVLVGLVHPRLFDLITLLKEHVVAQQRMVIIKQIAFNVDPGHINLLADGFGIGASEAHQLFEILKGCFGATGSFIRPTFESRVDAMTRHENVIFEILWCFLKQTPQRKDRLDFLNAIQLLMARLNDPKRALQFLMADICQNPQLIEYTDRNAFALAIVLLHKENRELYVDVKRTPEDVLRLLRPLNSLVRHYAIWRLEADQGRYLGKLRTIANVAQQIQMANSGSQAGPLTLSFVLALEREALIFSALVQGHTARVVLREALARYGDPNAAFYRMESARKHLSQLIAHLQIVVRALGRAGNHEDIGRLKSLEHQAKLFADLHDHPAHGLRVRQLMKWVSEAIKTIQSNQNRV